MKNPRTIAATTAIALAAITLPVAPASADHGILWPHQRTWVCQVFPAIC